MKNIFKKNISIITLFISIFVIYVSFSFVSYAQQNNTNFTKARTTNQVTDYGDTITYTNSEGLPTYNETAKPNSDGLYVGEDNYSYEDVFANKQKASGTSRSCQTRFSTLKDIIGFFTCVIQFYLIPISLIFLLLLYLYINSKFVFNADNEEGRTNFKKTILWMIGIMFIAFFIFQIASLVARVFGLETK